MSDGSGKATVFSRPSSETHTRAVCQWRASVVLTCRCAGRRSRPRSVGAVPFENVTIPGVVGEISTESSWGRYRFYVDGVRVKGRGFFRNQLALPGVAGEVVTVTVDPRMWHPYPILRVKGVHYRTGPVTPRNQMLLALLPLLAILFASPPTLLIIVIGNGLNMAVVRSDSTTPIKMALMAVVDLCALTLAAVVSVAYYS